MNLLPVLLHLYRLRYSLQSKSTLLIDQFLLALSKKWKFFRLRSLSSAFTVFGPCGPMDIVLLGPFKFPFKLFKT